VRLQLVFAVIISMRSLYGRGRVGLQSKWDKNTIFDCRPPHWEWRVMASSLHRRQLMGLAPLRQRPVQWPVTEYFVQYIRDTRPRTCDWLLRRALPASPSTDAWPGQRPKAAFGTSPSGPCEVPGCRWTTSPRPEEKEERGERTESRLEGHRNRIHPSALSAVRSADEQQ